MPVTLRYVPLVLLLLGWLPARAQAVEEARVYRLALEGEWAEAEFSGLAWHGDRLLMLPQFPARYAPPAPLTDSLVASPERPDGMFWVLRRSELRRAVEEALEGDPYPLHPEPLPFFDGGLARQIAGFEGYEALAFRGDTVYVTIEARDALGMYGYIATGHIGDEGLWLDPKSLMPIPPQARGGAPMTVSNMSYEALALVGGRALAFYEANGERLADDAAALAFDLAGPDSAFQPVPFPTLEYRVTDATPPDEEGRFWVLNVFWPGDAIKLVPQDDELASYGVGWTHARSPVVERLVQLQVTPDGVVRVPRPPVMLRLLPGGRTRNWEGLAPFEDGFLLVTDAYPDTRLAFVRPPR